MTSVPVVASAPSLLNVPPLLLLCGSTGPVVRLQVPCGSLMIVAPPWSTSSLPPIVPWSVAVPKFSSVSPLRVTEPSLAYAVMFRVLVLLAMKVPVPLIEPEPEFAFVQVAVPLTVIVSDPPSVPPVR